MTYNTMLTSEAIERIEHLDKEQVLKPCPFSMRRYEQVDTSEYASMFKWYEAFEEQTFGQQAGMRAAMRRWSFGLYPAIIKAAMAVFDVVESIAVSRTRICTAGGIHALSRVQVSPLLCAHHTSLQPCIREIPKYLGYARHTKLRWNGPSLPFKFCHRLAVGPLSQ